MLHYLKRYLATAGPDPRLVPDAAMHKPQLDGLGQSYRVIALDMRGHGESDKPTHRLPYCPACHRYARCPRGSQPPDVTSWPAIPWPVRGDLSCHHFGSDRLSKLILIDQALTATARPGWTDEKKPPQEPSSTPHRSGDTAASSQWPEGIKAIRESYRMPSPQLSAGAAYLCSRKTSQVCATMLLAYW